MDKFDFDAEDAEDSDGDGDVRLLETNDGELYLNYNDLMKLASTLRESQPEKIKDIDAFDRVLQDIFKSNQIEHPDKLN